MRAGRSINQIYVDTDATHSNAEYIARNRKFAENLALIADTDVPLEPE